MHEKDFSPIVGIYHSKDLDGVCSGAIIKYKYPNAIMIGYDYGDPIPEIPPGLPVIMADVSMPIAEMRRISEGARGEFTWIDHHISAINAYKESGYPYIEAVLDTSKSACELTWEHLFHGNDMPTAVNLLGIYDTWRQNDAVHGWEYALAFQYGMRHRVRNLWLEAFQSYLLSDSNGDNALPIKRIADDGVIILEYQEQQDEYLCRAAFETQFHGFRAICVNGGGGSNTMQSVFNPDHHDIMILWRYAGQHWSVSLRSVSDAVNVSEIAKQYGGGGHPKAAGFQVDDIKQIFPYL